MGSAKATFGFSSEALTAVQADGLIVPVFKAPNQTTNSTGKTKANQSDKNQARLQWTDALKALDKALQGQIRAVAEEEKFDGAKGKTLLFRKTSGDKVNAKRIILVGLGEADKVTTAHFENVLLRSLGPILSLKEPKNIAILLPQATEKLASDIAVQAAVDAVYQATYRSDEAKEKSPALQKITLLSPEKPTGQLTKALKQGETLARARSFVKDLVNKPSNLKSTNTLVDTAKAIGKLNNISVKIQADAKWIEKNMPCFYTVARGSVASDPPKWITLEYKPKSGKPKKHIALVGKSVIFDTGGYQVKPGDYMVTMKGDMTGGAVALGTMQALAELQPENISVTAYLAATPNKIDSDAMIPDSIVNTTCGKKVEIRHTDAEGRLTLIDAVAQAVYNKPDEIITVATLTGSASQAVGMYIALMGNNEALVGRINRAGKAVGEPIQTLDVHEEDYDAIKSKLDGADIINTSQKKQRGAQSAAAFVMSGAPEGTPMAHLDIAGADMTPDEKATGIGQKTILNYLLNENGQAASGSSRPTPASGATKTGSTKAKASAASSKKLVTRKARPVKKAGKVTVAKKSAASSKAKAPVKVSAKAAKTAKKPAKRK